MRGKDLAADKLGVVLALGEEPIFRKGDSGRQRRRSLRSKRRLQTPLLPHSRADDGNLAELWRFGK
jgi:hypothetical protein